MVTLWFAALSSSILGKSPTLVAHWNFANLNDQTVVTDVSGHHVDAQLLNGAKKVSLSANTTTSLTAALFLGNASTGAGFSAHHHSTIDKLYEFSIAFYINWWWAGADPVLAQKGGEDGFLLELYRQMPKVYIGDESGKIEYTWYPHQCAYLTPGQWKHVVLTYSDNGETNLYVDGVHCGDYRGSKGHLRSNDKDLTIGTFSGLVSDVRVYDKSIGQDLVDTICTPEILASYRAAPNFQTPSASAIAATNRGWRIDP